MTHTNPPHAHDYDMLFEDPARPLRATFRCACGDVAPDAETAIQRMRESHSARLAYRPPHRRALHPFPLACAFIFLLVGALNARLALATDHYLPSTDYVCWTALVAACVMLLVARLAR